jgi:hypothetical protein
MIAFWIVVAVVLVLLGLFVFTQGGQNLGPAIASIGVAILLVLLVAPARAHDHARPGLDGWYSGLKSGKGPCCDGPGVDALHLAEVDWESKDGRYRVRIEGEWVDVPDEAVLKEANRDGRTLVWPTWRDGKRAVRCFIPGMMT